MSKIKEKPPVTAALKEKIRAAPKELSRRGLDGGMERLRTQLRDAAQGGEREEYGEDRTEDGAAGAVQAGGYWAVRRLKGIQRWWADNRTDRTKEPPGPQNAPKGGVPPEGGVPSEGGVPLEEQPQKQGVPGRVRPSRQRDIIQSDGPGDVPEGPAVKTKDVYLQRQSASACTVPVQKNAQGSNAHAVEQGRQAVKGQAERQHTITAQPEPVTPPKASRRAGEGATHRPRPVEGARPSVRGEGATARHGIRTVHPKEQPGQGYPRPDRTSVLPKIKAASEHPTGPVRRSVFPARGASRPTVLAARQAVQTARNKSAGEPLRTVARAAVSTAKKAAAALRSLLSALLAGGWAAVVIVLLVCLLGLLLASPYGLFFSGEDVNGDGRTLRVVMREINTEFSQRLREIEEENPHDELDVGGTMVNWRDVLAIYAVRRSTESEQPMELVTLTLEKEAYLRQVFWDMNVITYEVEPVVSTTEDGAETVNVLRVRITGRSREEIAEVYSFTPAQMAQLDMLADGQLEEAWRYLLYGASGGSGDIVAAALAQVDAANDGGEKFWSWYGFGTRVDWCACFVSWCANECGYIDSGLIPRFASCTAGMNWFSVRGRWMESGYIPQPGDLIFFDWDLSGDAEHVGVVEHVEGGIVYTVEGNSGDAVRRNLYSLNDPQIRGYGLPVYP